MGGKNCIFFFKVSNLLITFYGSRKNGAPFHFRPSFEFELGIFHRISLKYRRRMNACGKTGEPPIYTATKKKLKTLRPSFQANRNLKRIQNCDYIGADPGDGNLSRLFVWLSVQSVWPSDEYIAPELFLLLMTSLFTFCRCLLVVYFPLSFFASVLSFFCLLYLYVIHLR